MNRMRVDGEDQIGIMLYSAGAHRRRLFKDLSMATTSIAGLVPGPLREFEEARQTAMIAGDVEALAALAHDDLVYIHSQGRQDSKQSYLASVASGLVRYIDISMEVRSALALGPEAWLIAGRFRAAVTVRGDAAQIDAAFTATWLRQADGWQLTSWQSTQWPAE